MFNDNLTLVLLYFFGRNCQDQELKSRQIELTTMPNFTDRLNFFQVDVPDLHLPPQFTFQLHAEGHLSEWGKVDDGRPLRAGPQPLPESQVPRDFGQQINIKHYVDRNHLGKPSADSSVWRTRLHSPRVGSFRDCRGLQTVEARQIGRRSSRGHRGPTLLGPEEPAGSGRENSPQNFGVCSPEWPSSECCLGKGFF